MSTVMVRGITSQNSCYGYLPIISTDTRRTPPHHPPTNEDRKARFIADRSLFMLYKVCVQCYFHWYIFPFSVMEDDNFDFLLEDDWIDIEPFGKSESSDCDGVPPDSSSAPNSVPPQTNQPPPFTSKDCDICSESQSSLLISYKSIYLCEQCLKRLCPLHVITFLDATAKRPRTMCLFCRNSHLSHDPNIPKRPPNSEESQSSPKRQPNAEGSQSSLKRQPNAEGSQSSSNRPRSSTRDVSRKTPSQKSKLRWMPGASVTGDVKITLHKPTKEIKNAML